MWGFLKLISLYHLIQQMSTKVPVSDMRKTLEEELQSCRQDLEIYKRRINLQKPESIRIYYEEKVQKEKQLEGCWFYEGMSDLTKHMHEHK